MCALRWDIITVRRRRERRPTGVIYTTQLPVETGNAGSLGRSCLEQFLEQVRDDRDVRKLYF